MMTPRQVPDTFTLSGDNLSRARQALEVARHQVRLAQADEQWRVEQALAGIEDAIAEHLARLGEAVEDARADAEESGEAEPQRGNWFPTYRAA